jgi:hypothetical protein
MEYLNLSPVSTTREKLLSLFVFLSHVIRDIKSKVNLSIHYLHAVFYLLYAGVINLKISAVRA